MIKTSIDRVPYFQTFSITIKKSSKQRTRWSSKKLNFWLKMLKICGALYKDPIWLCDISWVMISFSIWTVVVWEGSDFWLKIANAVFLGLAISPFDTMNLSTWTASLSSSFFTTFRSFPDTLVCDGADSGGCAVRGFLSQIPDHFLYPTTVLFPWLVDALYLKFFLSYPNGITLSSYLNRASHLIVDQCNVLPSTCHLKDL